MEKTTANPPESTKSEDAKLPPAPASAPATSPSEQAKKPTEAEAQKLEEEFIMIESQGRRRSSSCMNPTEAYDFWKVQKEPYIQFCTWEEDRGVKLRQIRSLASYLCDALVLTMSQVNSANQSLMAYFNLIASNAKELAKQTLKIPQGVDPLINYHALTGNQLAELYKKLKATDIGFSNNVKLLADALESSVAVDVKAMTVAYARALAGVKDSRPIFLNVSLVLANLVVFGSGGTEVQRVLWEIRRGGGTEGRIRVQIAAGGRGHLAFRAPALPRSKIRCFISRRTRNSSSSCRGS